MKKYVCMTEFICECGREFTNSQSLNAHYSHCLVHRNGLKPIDRFDGYRGKNQWSYVDWRDRDFFELSPVLKRKFLIEKFSGCCQECGYSKTRENGRSILTVHHIDGNRKNNVIENLQLLCPNCHTLTNNFAFNGRTHTVESRLKISRNNARNAKKGS